MYTVCMNVKGDKTQPNWSVNESVSPLVLFYIVL